MFLGITFIAKAYDLERDGIYYVITHEDEDLYDYFNYEGPHENFPRDEDGNWMFGDPNNGTVGVTSGDVSYTGYVSIPDCIEIHRLYGFTANVTSIQKYAFTNRTGLTGISMAAIDSIYAAAFYGCSGLTQVNFSGDETFIGDHAFAYCSSLTSITIPDGVVRLDTECFWKCSNLSTVVLGAGLTSMGVRVFTDCSSLSSITCMALIPPSITNSTFSNYNATLYVPASSLDAYKNANYWKNFTNIRALAYDFYTDGFYYKKTGANTVEVVNKGSGNTYSGNIYIPSSVYYNGTTYSVTGIGSQAFLSCSNLGTVSLSSTITYLGDRSFMRSNISRIVIPSNVTSIKSYAFYDCTSLDYVSLANGLTEIGSFAFSHCAALQNITIPRTVNNLSGTAFTYNTAMTNIYVNSANTHYTSKNGVVFTIDGKKLVAYPCGKGTSYTVPSGTEVIGTNSFRGSYALQSIIFPSTLKTVENAAFLDNTSITSLTFPYGVTRIENSAMQNCGSLNTVQLPSTLTYLGYYAFLYCSRLQNVIVKAKTPPVCQVEWDEYEDEYMLPFQQTHFNNTALEVPASSYSAYQNASVWKEFTSITGVDFDDEVVDLSLNVALNVDGGTINFTTESDYPWVVMGNEDRLYARSGNAGVANSISQVKAVVTLTQTRILDFEFQAYGEGSTTFWDKCSFLIDDVEQFSYGAHPVGWDFYSVYLSPGTHTLIWSYQKDGSVNPSGDYFALDNVGFRTVLYGDVDNDGQVNINDLTKLIDYLISLNTQGINFAAADVNGDGDINISDITALIDMLLRG